ncbi:hypothetical protein E2C01_052566 [Portunus trituberculatus]|uniref:Uncharacterized protein n=1 Tax=Portunus trituberculatus TaxID=210409 RepID=A0A5B7GEZ7_PORTR|nr:hypothetical protein [Portunus trituberculatus]
MLLLGIFCSGEVPFSKCYEIIKPLSTCCLAQKLGAQWAISHQQDSHSLGKICMSQVVKAAKERTNNDLMTTSRGSLLFK